MRIAGAVRAQGRQVLGRRVALVGREPVGRVQLVQGREQVVAVDLGNDRSRRDRGTLLSPLTMASAGMVRVGRRLPSTKTRLGNKRKPSTARRIASSVACKMFSASISSTLASPTLQHSALARTSSARRSRVTGPSVLESRSPLIGFCSSRITAAATTGPASGPRPASSTPATKPCTAQVRPSCSGSKDFFDRIGGRARGVAAQQVVQFSEARL